jgi:hypothetical protein
MNANCETTAMGIMPHRDVDKAIGLALSLDIPFWPQLPNVSFMEDMYAQASQGFPGIRVDLAKERVEFDSLRFAEEIDSYSERMNEPSYFVLDEVHSLVYHKFLSLDLGSCAAVRGQMTGPVSFGFRVVDENQRPIIYNDDVRTILYDFIQRKVNVQYQQLREKNTNAFVWVDEPGLGWVFSGLSGYDDTLAKQEFNNYLEGIEGARALHLCANINLPYLLDLGIDILSFDAYQIQSMPTAYADSVARFIRGGGIISWGIVPTDSDSLNRETTESLLQHLRGYWQVVAKETGLAVEHIARQSLIAPARCCLKNIGNVGAVGEAEGQKSEKHPSANIEEVLVEKAFAVLKQMSLSLRDAFSLL